MSPILTVSGLTKAFGGVIATDNVSFSVCAGDLLAVIGPNGAGKTTTFNMVGGQLRPDAGEIRLKGRSIAGVPPRVIWRLGVGRTFQVTATFASMTVAENVQMVLISARRRHLHLWSGAHAQYRPEALAVLDGVGIADQADRACSALAYGDLKRVELAIALAANPCLLLMDEPTAGMAPQERVELMRLVADIARERQIAVLFTEHDMDVVFGNADRVLVLGHGAVIAEGPPETIRADARVREVYLGSTGVEAAALANAVE